MDALEYYWKRALGTLTADEEQVWRGQQAAAQSLRAPAYVAPVQVQPGTALRARQDVMDSAMEELRRQGTLAPVSGAVVQRTPDEIRRAQEDEAMRRSAAGFSGVRN